MPSSNTRPLQIEPLIVCMVAMSMVFSFSWAETTLERILRSSVVRFGYADEAPISYKTREGKVTGESVEVLKTIFTKMGVKKFEAVQTEWAGLIPGLRSGRFDVIAAGMYITPERCEQVLFSDPLFQMEASLLVVKGNPNRLASYADVAKDSNIKLTVVAGTVELNYAQAAGIPDAQILLAPDNNAMLQALRSKHADAAIGTRMSMKWLAMKGGAGVEAIPHFYDDPEHKGYGALAFRRNDHSLREAANKQLHGWLGSKEHLRTVAPFGFDASYLTTKTASDLCRNGNNSGRAP